MTRANAKNDPKTVEEPSKGHHEAKPEDGSPNEAGQAEALMDEQASDEAAGDTPEAEGEIAGLEAKCAELEAALQTSRDQTMRALAELENIRKRSARERQEMARYAAAPLAKSIFPIADTLLRALEQAQMPSQQSEAEDRFTQFIEGVQMTHEMLLAAFKSQQIESYTNLGQPFDANRHEVMAQQGGSGKPAGEIINVLQPGYMMHERVLQPARVIVADGKDCKPAAESEAPGAEPNSKPQSD
ncbi:MAG: nucleotide exchange factor GrpE [Pseudomonadota bacterium]